MSRRYLPEKEGLYDPSYEHDACGVGFVAHLKGQKSNDIVLKGLQLLVNLEHRGAVGADKGTGDGAGILTQLPDTFFRKVWSNGDLPEFGRYGVAMAYLPQDDAACTQAKALLEKCVLECGQKVLGWRDVPTDHSDLGPGARSVEPKVAQLFVESAADINDPQAFERKLYVIRKYSESQILKSDIAQKEMFYVTSCSYKTIVYKGQLITNQVLNYFADLKDPDFQSALALIHSRFSTNTFPSWPLAQPFRYLAHNGEINTLRGNINWMKAREALLASDLFSKEDIERIRPVIDEDGSDSAVLDNAVELLTIAGRPLTEVMMMLIPEAWEKDTEMDPQRKAFYEYHATFMEPWDGPASVAFTDGHVIGATLDRNGLRPSRYCLSKDHILVMASEQGALEFEPENVELKGRLQPGRMFLADLREGRIISDEELKEKICSEHLYSQWLAEQKVSLHDLELKNPVKQPDHETVLVRQKCFGYSLEDLRTLMAPMVNNAYEPTGSMGSDTPVSVLSDKSHNLFNYFYQLFAQVTNPPIDPIREESVMSLVSVFGKQGNLLDEYCPQRRFIELPQPVLTNEELECLRGVDQKDFRAKTIQIVFDPKGQGALATALSRVREEALQAVKQGYGVLILSDHAIDERNAPIPALLATSAVHHHLIKAGLRSQCGIVLESGEVREVHHFAVCLGYGANAINPYLAFETIEDMRTRRLLNEDLDHNKAVLNYIHAVGKGLLKIMSKMGISTIQSYIGAQIFEAVGLGDSLIEEFFPGTASRLGGIDLATLELETLLRFRFAYPQNDLGDDLDLEVGGQYHWRQRGERHLFNPQTIHKLQDSSSKNDYSTYKEFAQLIDDQSKDLLTLRGLLEFQNAQPIDISEVEPIEEIVKRFATGAMSFGSISKEAHETLAIAMNRLGAKSNTGEGGEDPERFQTMPNGDSACSAIKQVASGRFGVTSNYLVSSKEIQIKMAQGAKPGEGGQLPGHKVDKVIAKTRYSTPGVGLISPPPHHDIYSIEDLAQLIHDLKNANTKARINVKLVSEVGVGTIAAGVSKAHADVVLISGYDGGTGASPLTSIKHAGLPWELGLAETHQTLVKNGLRSRIVVQTDGQMRTGRDLAIATLLGAEEWGVATAALVVEGCIMMRKCHLNTCPVGIATQRKELRAKYTGNPDHVVNYFRFLAEHLREIMAELGFKTVNEMVGRVDKLKAREDVDHWKAKNLDLNRLLYKMDSSDKTYCCVDQDHGLDKALDHQLLQISQKAIEQSKAVQENVRIQNINRTVGTILSSEISRRYADEGLPSETIHLKMTGTAGQSFSAFGARGVTLELEGDANDYFGKGLSGSRLILYPPKVSTFDPRANVIVGNVAFYGATGGEAYIRGLAGERFCVRNSGARVVVESIGDHGCEYMTGGRVVVLGEVGKNFAAGMSGGIAYLWDEKGNLKQRINMGMVDLETLQDPAEVDELRMMIENHRQFTGSRGAQAILNDWQNQVQKFVKVMPTDYKRALAEMAKEKAHAEN